MKKKIFVALIIFFVLSSGSLLIYNFFFKEKTETKIEENKEKAEIKAISEKQAFAPFLENGQVKYYLAQNGHVVQSKFDGTQKKEISTTDLKDLKKVAWSPDGKKVIGFYGETTGNGVKKSVFDYITKKSYPLDANIRSIAWSPDSKKIIYQYSDNQGNNNISAANQDGSGWHNILQTRLGNLVVECPTPGKISLRSVPNSQTKGFLFVLEEKTENIVAVLDDLNGFSAKWSPDGQKILYQTTNAKGQDLKLFVADSQGQNSLQLPAITLVEKCAWSANSQKIFCAAPQNISDNATWPEDWLDGLVSVKDDLYELSADGKEKTKIVASDEARSFDVNEIIASPQGDYVLFTSRRDGLLWSVAIPNN
ncbi:MAG: hypothetical protein PHQ47_00065 [Candidatus Portnoybacteria bacterium]|nr:hypothetical protein [Candidatus Portnoybacteria bacterium]